MFRKSAAAILFFFLILFSLSADNRLGMLSWNLESGGSDPGVLAEELIELHADIHPEILILTEVIADAPARLFKALEEALGYRAVVSALRGNDRLAVLYDPGVFALKKTEELTEIALISMRSALAVTLRTLSGKKEIIVTAVHLARNPDYTRQAQSRALRIWAGRKRSLPLFLAGDFNYDIDVNSLIEGGVSGMERDRGFDILTEGESLRWLKPVNPTATQFTDRDRNGENDYNAILDCVFVNARAFEFLPVSRVILRAGDFPDTDATSDHRPLYTEFYLE